MPPRIFKPTQTKPLNGMFAAIAQRLIAPQRSVIEVFCVSVEKVLGVKLDARFISYTPASKTLYLNTSGMIKQEVRMREMEIFKTMQETLGIKSMPKKII